VKSFDAVRDKNLSIMCKCFAEMRYYIRSNREGGKGKGLFACICTFEIPFLVLNFRKYVYILLLIMKIFYFSVGLSEYLRHPF